MRESKTYSPMIKISNFEELRPAKPYAEMEDYGRTRRFRVSAEFNNEIRKFIIYEFLEENEDNICYVVSGYCSRLGGSRNKDFYYDENGVFFPAWGISWKRVKRHKFDEEEVEKIAKITGFEHAYKQKRGFVVYIHKNRESILLESRINEGFVGKLILGWLACWELI